MADLSELIERLEAASEPSRELDLDITEALGLAGRHALSLVPFTASIDAALTLVPKRLAWAVGLDESDTTEALMSWAWCLEPDAFAVTVAPEEIVHAATPSLALCIAALRARQVKENG